MQSRLLCSDLIVVEWQPTNKCEQTASAVINEISARGACLLLDHPIAAETLVRLICGNCRLRGKVSRCEQEEASGYVLYVDFVSGEQWSAERYRPQHLLDPASLPTVGCAGGLCPHTNVCAAAKDASSTEKVRSVAREVAAVCHNLNTGLLTSCFRNLYGPERPDEVLNEFIDAYQQARRSAPVR